MTVPQPTVVTLSVTGRCNSKCIYCGNPDYPKQTDVGEQYWLKLIDDIADLGARIIVFSGGEPLLRRDLRNLIKRANDQGLVTQVITNGLVLTKKRLEVFADAGLHHIALSCDTINPDLYERIRGASFKQAQRALDLLGDWVRLHPRRARVGAVLTPLNISHVEMLARDVWQRGLSLSVQPVFGAKDRSAGTWSKASLSTLDALIEWLLTQLRRGSLIEGSESYLEAIPRFVRGEVFHDHRCTAPDHMFIVDHELRILPCCGMTDEVGNAGKAELMVLFRGTRWNEARQHARQNKCPGCFFRCIDSQAIDRMFLWMREMAGKGEGLSS